MGILAACETPQKAPAPVDAAPSPPHVAEPPAPPPVAPPVAPAPAGPASPAAQQQAQRMALAAAELLESGSEEPARAGLQRALALDPQNKLALSLTRQLTTEALSALPRESFAYTVQPSDTMSRIAQRFLGDIYSFYILARYNDIKVPRQVAAGQVIRIPGKAPAAAPTSPSAAAAPRAAPAPVPAPAPAPPPPAPAAPSPAPAPAPPAPAPPAPAPPAPAPTPAPPAPPAPPPEPTPAERAMRSAAALEKAGDLTRARAEYQSAANLGQPGAAAKADQLRAQLVARSSTEARAALARQDLDGSIAGWQRVLELEPDNAGARYELERVRGLKEKLRNVK